MNGKPVIYRDALRVLNLDSEGFGEKRLCDAAVLNLGDTCVYSCQYCYSDALVRKWTKGDLDEYNAAEGCLATYRDVVIRRKNALEILKNQLITKTGEPKFSDPADRRMVFVSSLVDIAANMELLGETAGACRLILENTNWQIRLLSKSHLLDRLIKDSLIPEKFFGRIVFGMSTGTIDDRVAAAIETKTALVSLRLKTLHWLQDHDFRTYGMVCPVLPQEDYPASAKTTCDAIRADKCEHIWAEPINVRGPSLTRTVAALKKANLSIEAERMSAVCGSFERYCRAKWGYRIETSRPPAYTKVKIQFRARGADDPVLGVDVVPPTRAGS